MISAWWLLLLLPAAACIGYGIGIGLTQSCMIEMEDRIRELEER